MVASGFYSIGYGGATGSGIGMLALANGTITGIDEAGVQYDGEYGEDAVTGDVQVHIKATIPANVALVIGVPARTEPWSFAIDSVLPATFANGTPIRLRTPFAPVQVSFRLLRRL